MKDLLRLVMRDEARHVAFGVLSLDGYYAEMPANELADRENFERLGILRFEAFDPEGQDAALGLS